MAGLFNILKVTVSEDKICAHVLEIGRAHV